MQELTAPFSTKSVSPVCLPARLDWVPRGADMALIALSRVYGFGVVGLECWNTRTTAEDVG